MIAFWGSQPITEKESHETEAHGLKFGAAAMQGWRVEMEDAHTVAEHLGTSLLHQNLSGDTWAS
jgi:hypothetical protein